MCAIKCLPFIWCKTRTINLNPSILDTYWTSVYVVFLWLDKILLEIIKPYCILHIIGRRRQYKCKLSSGKPPVGLEYLGENCTSYSLNAVFFPSSKCELSCSFWKLTCTIVSVNKNMHIRTHYEKGDIENLSINCPVLRCSHVHT